MDDLLVGIKAQFGVIKRDDELCVTPIHSLIYSSVYLEV